MKHQRDWSWSPLGIAELQISSSQFTWSEYVFISSEDIIRWEKFMKRLIGTEVQLGLSASFCE